MQLCEEGIKEIDRCFISAEEVKILIIEEETDLTLTWWEVLPTIILNLSHYPQQCIMYL